MVLLPIVTTNTAPKTAFGINAASAIALPEKAVKKTIAK